MATPRSKRRPGSATLEEPPGIQLAGGNGLRQAFEVRRRGPILGQGLYGKTIGTPDALFEPPDAPPGYEGFEQLDALDTTEEFGSDDTVGVA